MERRSLNGNFKSNISLGGIGECIDPPEEMAQLAIEAAKSLRLDIAGIDILYDEKGFRICEANSSPGFVGLEKACPVSVPDKVFDYVSARINPPEPPRKPLWRRIIPGLRGKERQVEKEKA